VASPIILDFNTTSAISVGSAPAACSSSGSTNYLYNPSISTFKIFQ
jgi:hypothetical protein